MPIAIIGYLRTYVAIGNSGHLRISNACHVRTGTHHGSSASERALFAATSIIHEKHWPLYFSTSPGILLVPPPVECSTRIWGRGGGSASRSGTHTLIHVTLGTFELG